MDYMVFSIKDARLQENQTILNFIGPLGDICDTPLFPKSQNPTKFVRF